MRDELDAPFLDEWMHDTEVTPPDPQEGARRVATQLPRTRQVGRWLPFVVFRPKAPTPTPGHTADYQPTPIPASNGRTPTVSGRTQSMFSPVKAIAAGLFVFAIGGALFIAQPFDQQGSVPGAAAPGVAEGTLAWANNIKCRIDQDVVWSLSLCEQDDTGTFTFPLVTADAMTGTFDGVQARDGVLEYGANGDFTFSGRGLFMGTVEGCGSGTVYFEASAEGHDADGVATYTSNMYTIVPGGTLPVAGSLDMSGTEILDGDGNKTIGYTGTYTCDAE